MLQRSAPGKVVRIRDIARVEREYDTSESYIENPERAPPCVLLSLEMISGNNIMAYGDDVDRVLDDFRADELPDDVTLTRIADQPKVVGDSIRDFLRDLMMSMAYHPGADGALPLASQPFMAGVTIPLHISSPCGHHLCRGHPLKTSSHWLISSWCWE